MRTPRDLALAGARCNVATEPRGSSDSPVTWFGKYISPAVLAHRGGGADRPVPEDQPVRQATLPAAARTLGTPWAC